MTGNPGGLLNPEPMSNNDLANVLANALGSPHFNPDQVIEVLAEQAKKIQDQGGNAGSLIVLANILPEITEEAKKRY